MTKNFEESVKKAFENFFRRHPSRLLRSEYSAEEFGNALVAFETEDYLLRFIRDRSQEFVEVASLLDPENWHNLGRVLAAISGQESYERLYGGPVELNEVADVLNGYHVDLVKSLSPVGYDRTLRELERLGKLAKERLLGLFPSE